MSFMQDPDQKSPLALSKISLPRPYIYIMCSDFWYTHGGWVHDANHGPDRYPPLILG